MLDTLQIIFWSITYVLIIIAGFLSRNVRKISMPYIAGVLNFAWEVCALYNSQGFWGHVLWLSLDLIIVFWGFAYIKSSVCKAGYGVSLLICTLILLYVFTFPKGMLFSVFIIDLIMAITYLAYRKKLSPKLKVPIAIMKLLGDACAGLYYAPQSNLVGIIACIVFMCNVCYLYLCVEETRGQIKD